MSDLPDVYADLTAEGAELDRLLGGLAEDQWATATPAPGWTVRDQIAHLIFIFRAAGLSATDPGAFEKMSAQVGADFDGAVNAALAEFRDTPPDHLLAAWREQRARTIDALRAVPAGQFVPWLVRPLPANILGSAGFMETFAHGQDVFDALGVQREPNDRIGHLLGFAMLTKDFGYLSRGLTPPQDPFRFELTMPSGLRFEFGPQDAEQRVTGSAWDFCLLVVRRRNRADLDLTATGEVADAWLDLAQAYRGPAGEGRKPGQFAVRA